MSDLRFCSCGHDMQHTVGMGHCRTHHRDYAVLNQAGAGCPECDREREPLQQKLDELMVQIQAAKVDELTQLRASLAAVTQERDFLKQCEAVMDINLEAAEKELDHLRAEKLLILAQVTEYDNLIRDALQLPPETEWRVEFYAELIKRQTFALNEVSTHLGAVESIIKYAIEQKPSGCILTDKYDGICPHCESDISWLQHELKAHGEYSAAITKALGALPSPPSRRGAHLRAGGGRYEGEGVHGTRAGA